MRVLNAGPRRGGDRRSRRNCRRSGGGAAEVLADHGACRAARSRADDGPRFSPTDCPTAAPAPPPTAPPMIAPVLPLPCVVTAAPAAPPTAPPMIAPRCGSLSTDCPIAAPAAPPTPPPTAVLTSPARTLTGQTASEKVPARSTALKHVSSFIATSSPTESLTLNGGLPSLLSRIFPRGLPVHLSRSESGVIRHVLWGHAHGAGPIHRLRGCSAAKIRSSAAFRIVSVPFTRSIRHSRDHRGYRRVQASASSMHPEF